MVGWSYGAAKDGANNALTDLTGAGVPPIVGQHLREDSCFLETSCWGTYWTSASPTEMWVSRSSIPPSIHPLRES
eukprot:7626943-Pyramimonas_sp.AAC.1